MSISWGEIGVSAFSVLASAGVSVYISKRTAKAEIEKLRAIWAHEKEAASDSDFDAMVVNREGMPKSRSSIRPAASRN